MITYFSDIFPSLERFSNKLDNLTLLINQHWVSIDNIMSNKTVYIFRSKNELLVSVNGKVEKAKWEYLGNNSILIEQSNNNYLFRHGFFDENILALKLDSEDQYAVFVNESRCDIDLNSIAKIETYLSSKYKSNQSRVEPIRPIQKPIEKFSTDKGEIEIELLFQNANPCLNNKVMQHGRQAKDGKYKLGFMYFIIVKSGVILDITLF